MGTPLESEVKVKCSDVDALVAAHRELGWEVVSPRHFEDNFVFELPEHALERRGSILRLRIAEGRAILTYKGLVPESATSEMKVREEIETGVDPPEALVAIFERLGLRRAFRYQKYRTVYRLAAPGGHVLAMRDETPFGDFLEIEGEEADVSAVAATLGFAPASYIRESYIGIQAALCRARGVPLQDLVFERE
jgi:adenylate cyclase class 2